MILFNGRFLTARITGVERFSREALLGVIRLSPGVNAWIALPPNQIAPVADFPLLEESNDSYRGVSGHLWEQLRLPRLLRAAGNPPLVSLANWGPIRAGKHIVLLHDAAVFVCPQFFGARYVRWARWYLRAIARSASRIATTSLAARADLARFLSINETRIQVVTPGVGSPFTRTPLRPPADPPYCLFVGAHDARKNLGFLLQMWPGVYRRFGLRLIVVGRRTSRAHRSLTSRGMPTWATLVWDPTDADLVDLYANAVCLLSPSYYEGFGFPLLEAMAAGTPFLSTATGAAAELAVEADRQVLRLEPSAWEAGLRWTLQAGDELRRESSVRARVRTWDRTGRELQGLISSVTGV